MDPERVTAVERLKALGFSGTDVYLAELIPATEMAWADGQVQPNEVAVLESYCEALVTDLNREVGARLFSTARALKQLRRLLKRRLSNFEREWAIESLRRLSLGTRGHEMRERIIAWCEAVAAVDGSPVWDVRELFWLQRVRRSMGLA